MEKISPSISPNPTGKENDSSEVRVKPSESKTPKISPGYPISKVQRLFRTPELKITAPIESFQTPELKTVGGSKETPSQAKYLAKTPNSSRTPNFFSRLAQNQTTSSAAKTRKLPGNPPNTPINGKNVATPSTEFGRFNKVLKALNQRPVPTNFATPQPQANLRPKFKPKSEQKLKSLPDNDTRSKSIEYTCTCEMVFSDQELFNAHLFETGHTADLDTTSQRFLSNNLNKDIKQLRKILPFSGVKKIPRRKDLKFQVGKLNLESKFPS